MKYDGNPHNQMQDGRDSIDDACVEAADELLYKLANLKRERTTLANLVNRRLRANLPLNSPDLLAQAEKVNRLLEDDAIAELFRFLRTSTWAQSRLDEQTFRQQSLVLESLYPYDKRCLLSAHEEMQMLFSEPLRSVLHGNHSRGGAL